MYSVVTVTAYHLHLPLGHSSGHGVVDKLLTLYPGVLISIPGSSSPSDETLSHGPVSILMLNRNSLNL